MLALIASLLIHFALSFVGQLKFSSLEYALTLKSRFTGTIKILVASKNKPNIIVIVIIIIIIIIIIIVVVVFIII